MSSSEQRLGAARPLDRPNHASEPTKPSTTVPQTDCKPREPHCKAPEPQISSETSLRSVWAQLLDTDHDSLSAEDDFYELGGDSILTMKLVSVARSESRALTLQGILHHPTLSEMAPLWDPIPDTQKIQAERCPPFALLDVPGIEHFLSETLLKPYGLCRQRITNAYFSPWLQVLEVKANKNRYTSFKVSTEIDVDLLVRSLNLIVQENETLRTVFVPQRDDLLAVVLRDLPFPVEVWHADEARLPSLMTQDNKEAVPHGQPMGKIIIVKQDPRVHHVLVRMNHGIHDGTSSRLLFGEDLKHAFATGNIPQRLSFHDVLYARTRQDRIKAVSYWQDLLAGSSMTHLQDWHAEPPSERDLTRRITAKTVHNIRAPRGYAPDTLIKAVWALVMARRSASADVVFWQTINGRRFGGTEIENSIGPCYQCFPIRAKIDEHWQMTDLCHLIQSQEAEGLEYEMLQVEEIMQCAGWKWDPNNATLVALNHTKDEQPSSITLGERQCEMSTHDFNDAERQCEMSTHDFNDAYHHIELEVASSRDKVTAQLCSPVDLVDQCFAEAVVDEYCTLLVHFSQDPHSRITEHLQKPSVPKATNDNEGTNCPGSLQEPHDDGLAGLRRYVQEGGGSIESMRLLSRQQLAKMEERIVVPVSELQDVKMAIVRSLKSQPIAIHADVVDSQIYEADVELWKLRLGPRMKISAGHWPQLPSGAWSLAKAELAMLELYVERAQIEDGQDILDLGCGYGSTALYLAERFPHSRIVAMTVTASHIVFIKMEMARRGLTNIVTCHADINTYEAAPASFDRIVSIELLEYLRNYDLLFAKLSVWLRPAGLLFIEFTTHATTCYEAKEVLAEYTGEENYLSADVLHYFQRNLTLLDQWWVNGKHYAATLDAWLEQLSANRDRAMTLLRAKYGDKMAEVEYRKIEWYLWLGSEEFAFKDGNALGLSHYLFEVRSTEPSSMSGTPVEGISASPGS